MNLVFFSKKTQNENYQTNRLKYLKNTEQNTSKRKKYLHNSNICTIFAVG